MEHLLLFFLVLPSYLFSQDITGSENYLFHIINEKYSDQNF